MGLRFSLKWLLAAVVYAAVAAAALSQPTWVYADLVWVATLAAFGYALALACFARGTSQARGGGFAMLAAAFVVCVYLAPDSVPTVRLLKTMGVSDSMQVNVAVPPPAMMASQATATYSSQGYVTLVAPPTTTGSLNLRPAPPMPQGNTFSAQGDPNWPAKLRAANAVGTMAMGLLGCLLGSWAARKRPSSEATKTAIGLAAVIWAVLQPGIPALAAPTSINYVDATDGPTGNTRVADGGEFNAVKTSPLGNDNLWTLRPFANGGTVFTANDGMPPGPEDAPGLVTTISGLTPGERYVVYAYFWSDQHNWHLQAALSPPDGSTASVSAFKPSTNARAKPAVKDRFASTVLVTEANRILQQAPLGQAAADGHGEIRVWIDDLANTVSANRTWYDGVGYAVAPRGQSLWPTGSSPLRWLGAGLLLAAVAVAYASRRFFKASQRA